MITENQISNYWNKVAVQGPIECWPWTASTRGDGYGAFGIGNVKDGTKRMVSSHRLAYYLSHNDQWPENYACHTCNNKLCCNPGHIYDGTHQDNMDDMTSGDRQARGENQGLSKLTEDQVLEIRSRYEPWIVTLRTLAAEYGISNQVIHDIIQRRIWKHI